REKAPARQCSEQYGRVVGVHWCLTGGRGIGTEFEQLGRVDVWRQYRTVRNLIGSDSSGDLDRAEEIAREIQDVGRVLKQDTAALLLPHRPRGVVGRVAQIGSVVADIGQLDQSWRSDVPPVDQIAHVTMQRVVAHLVS